MSEQTDLSIKIRARADADGLSADHELRAKADAFDAATTGYYSEPQTVAVAQFMGAWARARRAWCGYSGEPLA